MNRLTDLAWPEIEATRLPVAGVPEYARISPAVPVAMIVAPVIVVASTIPAMTMPAAIWLAVIVFAAIWLAVIEFAAMTLVAFQVIEFQTPAAHWFTWLPALVLSVCSVWMLSLAALVVLWSRRPHLVIDIWLMVVLCTWLFDIVLTTIVNSARFDLGYYAGRVYGLCAASVVLDDLSELGGLTKS